MRACLSPLLVLYFLRRVKQAVESAEESASADEERWLNKKKDRRQERRRSNRRKLSPRRDGRAVFFKQEDRTHSCLYSIPSLRSTATTKTFLRLSLLLYLFLEEWERAASLLGCLSSSFESVSESLEDPKRLHVCMYTQTHTRQKRRVLLRDPVTSRPPSTCLTDTRTGIDTHRYPHPDTDRRPYRLQRQAPTGVESRESDKTVRLISEFLPLVRPFHNPTDQHYRNRLPPVPSPPPTLSSVLETHTCGGYIHRDMCTSIPVQLRSAQRWGLGRAESRIRRESVDLEFMGPPPHRDSVSRKEEYICAPRGMR